MAKKKIVNSYVDAILEIKKDNIDDFYFECLEWKKVLLADNNISKILNDVTIDPNKKEALLKGVFDFAKISSYFFFFVIRANCGQYWFDIIETFIKKYKDIKKIFDVKIVSSISLDNENLEKIKVFLKKFISYNELIFENIIDEKIINGFIIFVNNTKIDFSIKKFLQQNY